MVSIAFHKSAARTERRWNWISRVLRQAWVSFQALFRHGQYRVPQIRSRMGQPALSCPANSTLAEEIAEDDARDPRVQHWGAETE